MVAAVVVIVAGGGGGVFAAAAALTIIIILHHSLFVRTHAYTGTTQDSFSPPNAVNMAFGPASAPLTVDLLAVQRRALRHNFDGSECDCRTCAPHSSALFQSKTFHSDLGRKALVAAFTGLSPPISMVCGCAFHASACMCVELGNGYRSGSSNSSCTTIKLLLKMIKAGALTHTHTHGRREGERRRAGRTRRIQRTMCLIYIVTQGQCEYHLN